MLNRTMIQRGAVAVISAGHVLGVGPAEAAVTLVERASVLNVSAVAIS